MTPVQPLLRPELFIYPLWMAILEGRPRGLLTGSLNSVLELSPLHIENGRGYLRQNWKHKTFAQSKRAAINHSVAKAFHSTIYRFYFFVPAGSAKNVMLNTKWLHTSGCILGGVKCIQKNGDTGSVSHFCLRGRTQVESILKSASVTPHKLRSLCCDVPFRHEELKHLLKPNTTVDVWESFQKHFWKCFAAYSCEKPLLWRFCFMSNVAMLNSLHQHNKKW